MKFRAFSFLAIVLAMFPVSAFAFIPAVCDLCTVGVIAGLAVSRYLGVDDSVVGVWIGAMLVALVSVSNAYLAKKRWTFPGYSWVVWASYVGFSFASFRYAGVIGLHRNTFFKSTSLLADKVLVSAIVGWAVLVVASMAYQWLKKRNGGHAHFPFEKVVLPLVSLVITSAVFYFVTLR